MNIHFIAIGGSVMHNLAIALKEEGHQVTGSDDHIFDPSKSRLEQAGLLPSQEGWFPEKITGALQAVILGMHAKADNPELAKAKELNIPIYSYPEFIYKQSINKQRIVIGGSHGKTTVTSIIIHVLHHLGKKFDYILGAVPKGLSSSVRLSDDAPIIVIEGDEYPTSPLDPTPKFMHYHHHIATITGIAWDHYNVYPNYDGYVAKFKAFVESTPKAGAIIYNTSEKTVEKLMKGATVRHDVLKEPYELPKHKVKDGQTFLNGEDKTSIPLKVFGDHNLLNIHAAKKVCKRIGVTSKQFEEAIASFGGAKLRLEAIESKYSRKVYRDFAHAPSKVLATVNSVKKQFAKMKLTACVELHTYSSLNKEFINQYKDALKKADLAVVYYNPQTVALKGLKTMSEQELQVAFNRKDLKVFTESDALERFITQSPNNSNLLLMSSGNFGGIDWKGKV